MDYIKKYGQINEELKRKLTPDRLKKQQEDERREIAEKRPLDLFTEEEMKILKDDDFEIDKNEKEAKNVEKYATFIIKKGNSLNENEVIYSLTAVDNRDGKTIYERRIPVTKRNQHKDTLDFLIDRCSYILMNMKKEAMRSIDPYGEEDWEEENKPKTPEQRVFDDW